MKASIEIIKGFYEGFSTPINPHTKKDSMPRPKLSQKQLDRMIDDSFPASDPPSTY